jgi:hypothetical protein
VDEQNLSWSGILAELNATALPNLRPPDYDGVRRKYLRHLSEKTNRHTILYATKFTQRDPNLPAELISIVDEDVQGLMEVVRGSKTKKLDLILHSPGGSLDAAEGIVNYLREKFSDIRVIVPQLAQSAATMICCAANEVMMGAHSSLGPIDPQIFVNTALGAKFVPAQAIIDQFEQAKQECADKDKVTAWLPMLTQYGPHLIKTCSYLTELSSELVEKWLSQYMFHGDGKAQKAKQLAAWLSDHKKFKTHARHIPRSELKAKGMNVTRLEDDQTIQDLALATFHATTHAFDGTNVVKIIENQFGKSFMKMVLTRPARPFPIPNQSPAPTTAPARSEITARKAQPTHKKHFAR